MRDLVELARGAYGKGEARYCGDSDGPHEAGWLTLEIAKARMVLDVNPKFILAEAVHRTMAWYRAQQQRADARSLCEAEITAYEALT